MSFKVDTSRIHCAHCIRIAQVHAILLLVAVVGTLGWALMFQSVIDGPSRLFSCAMMGLFMVLAPVSLHHTYKFLEKGRGN